MSRQSDPSSVERVSMLETMMLIRTHEQRLPRCSPTLPGTCTAVGQEAAAVGVVRAFGAARPHPHPTTAARATCWRAVPTRVADGEVMGRVDGYCKGKKRFTARLGGLARRRADFDHRRRRAVAGTGRGAGAEDGAAGARGPHDGVLRRRRGLRRQSSTNPSDLAGSSRWAAAVLYVCEKPVGRPSWPPRPDDADGARRPTGWGAGHGIASDIVDGNDVEAVHAAALAAVAAIRASGRPHSWKLTTYRRLPATSSPTTRPMSTPPSCASVWQLRARDRADAPHGLLQHGVVHPWRTRPPAATRRHRHRRRASPSPGTRAGPNARELTHRRLRLNRSSHHADPHRLRCPFTSPGRRDAPRTSAC